MEVKRYRYKKNIFGFSLIELAIVLTITGLTLLTSLYVIRTQSSYYNIITTQTKLDTLNTVLQTYNQKHGKYPCPAPLNAAAGSDGIASTSCTTCSGTYGPNPYYCIANDGVVIGAVPFETLELPRQLSFDVWDQKIIYAIDSKHTEGKCQNSGQIQIINKNGVQVNNSAIYALISTGIDGKGGYNSNGVINKACNNSASDGQNCAFTISQANFSNIFRISTIHESATNTNYDDIIKWQTNTSLAFCPAQVSNCILWMDGADVCTVTADATNQITSWLDKSPSNLEATVPASSNAPVFINAAANLLNKNTYLNFTAANFNLLSIANSFNAFLTTNFTKIIVFRTSSISAGAITAAAEAGSFASTADRQFGPISSGQMGFIQGGSQINSSSIYTDGNAHIATITVDTTAGETMFVDGIQVATGTQTASTIAIDSLLIGGSSAWDYYNGDILEILIYDNALSNIERKTVESYLATKWGIAY